MKKKLIAVMLILAVATAGAFASVISLSVGATAQYQLKAAEAWDAGVNGEWGKFTDLSQWSFGGEARVKILFLEATINGLYNKTDDTNTDYAHEVSFLTSGGLTINIAGFLRLGVGLGPRFSLKISDTGDYVIQGGGATGFVDSLKNSPMSYRASADFTLGPVMIGVNYTVDTAFTFAVADFADLAKPNWDSGKIGVSLLYTIF